MKILAVLPMQEELDFCVRGCVEQGWDAKAIIIGRVHAMHFNALGLTLAAGGLGKAQFAAQTQHLIDQHPDWGLVICAGAAGALDDRLAVGDVVIGVETIEFDIRNKFGPPLQPRFVANAAFVEGLMESAKQHASFKVFAGRIASGDEDIIDTQRRAEVRDLTGALANGWEGAGGARACAFSNLPFVEIRGISDEANPSAAQDFVTNLPKTMRNVAHVIAAYAKSVSTA